MLTWLHTPLRRSLHTGLVRFQFVKNIYKKIDYRIEFKDKMVNYRYQSESEEILKKLNVMTASQLELYTSKKLSKAIVSHRNANGQFECAEQLLDIQNVEQQHIEKLVLKFLKNPEEELDAVRKEKQLRRTFNRDIIPKPDLDAFRENIRPSFTGVHITLQGVTFAKTCEGSLQGWNSWDLKEDLDFDPASNVSYKHNNLFEVSKNFLQNESFEIPVSDYMIFEESLPLLPKDPYLKPKTNLLKLKSTLMTMLMMENPQSMFHTVKTGALDAVVNLRQGSERVSVSDKLIFYEGQIFTKRLQDALDRQDFLLNCDDELWLSFTEKRSLQKDYLGLALLKATAFEKLCSNKESDE